MGLERKSAEQVSVVDKYVSTTDANLTLTTRDQVVRVNAAAAAVVLTLPSVVESRGRFYSILVRSADPTNTVTIQDNDESEHWSDLVIVNDNVHVVLFSDGMSWAVEYVNKPVHITGEIADISTAGSHWVVCPVAGTIIKIYSVIANAITTANAALTFELEGVAITGGGITVAFTGSAAGTLDSSVPTTKNTIAAGKAIELITDGGSSTSCKAVVTFVIIPS